jgi:uncharacterized protein YbjQ (UPF0145 family)
MPKPWEINVTTSPIIDGWTIDEYCGVVTSQVVAGTGFFSDLAASLSDLFGGRSGTYQRQLASLRSEAIEQLREQALRAGGNWVIGVRMDFDEISGKSKQMFMVTAQGTAVMARRASSDAVQPQGRVLSGDDLDFEVERMRLVERARSGKLCFDDDTWEALTEHRVDEAVPFAIAEIHRLKKEFMDVGDAKRHTMSFLRELPLEAVQRHLHDAVLQSEDLASIAQEFIVAMGVVDLRWVQTHLTSSDLERRRALQLLRGHASFYSISDVGTIEAIIALLETAFPENVEVRQHRRKLSRKMESLWQCGCGTDNRTDDERCTACERDKRGLHRTDFLPEEAAAELRERAAVLRGKLG